MRWHSTTCSSTDCSALRCRALGDQDLKGAGGLTAEPEVTSRDLDDKDAFLIAASDGLWDCISNEEAVNIVHDTGVQEAQLIASHPCMQDSHTPLPLHDKINNICISESICSVIASNAEWKPHPHLSWLPMPS